MINQLLLLLLVQFDGWITSTIIYTWNDWNQAESVSSRLSEIQKLIDGFAMSNFKIIIIITSTNQLPFNIIAKRDINKPLCLYFVPSIWMAMEYPLLHLTKEKITINFIIYQLLFRLPDGMSAPSSPLLWSKNQTIETTQNAIAIHNKMSVKHIQWMDKNCAKIPVSSFEFLPCCVFFSFAPPYLSIAIILQ